MPIHRQDFASFSDFVKAARDGKPTVSSYERRSRTSGNHWAGGTFDAVTRLAATGWKEGAEKIEKMGRPIFESLSSHMMKPEIVFDVEGDTIDIGSYMTGNPEPFLRWDETEIQAERQGKFVHIVMNGSVSSSFSAEQMFARGAAVAVLIDALEMSGHRVSLDLAFGSKSGYGDGGYQVRTTIRIKNAEDNLDRENVAFACAHAGMFRRLGFSVWEQAPREFLDNIGITSYGGYGMPHHWNSEADVKIDSSTSEIGYDPTPWIRSQLVKFGVQFDN